jgi:predicted aspartyl protease
VHNVNYTHLLSYRTLPNHTGVYPVAEIQVLNNGSGVDLPAVIDTGALVSLISGEYAIALGIDLKSGVYTELSSLGGTVVAWIHNVQVKLFDLQFSLKLHFAEARLARNIVGRDVLEKLQVGFREYHNSVLLLLQQ